MNKELFSKIEELEKTILNLPGYRKARFNIHNQWQMSERVDLLVLKANSAKKYIERALATILGVPEGFSKYETLEIQITRFKVNRYHNESSRRIQRESLQFNTANAALAIEFITELDSELARITKVHSECSEVDNKLDIVKSNIEVIQTKLKNSSTYDISEVNTLPTRDGYRVSFTVSSNRNTVQAVQRSLKEYANNPDNSDMNFLELLTRFTTESSFSHMSVEAINNIVISFNIVNLKETCKFIKWLGNELSAARTD